MEDLTFAVPTLFGLEGLCADEMRRLNLPQVRAENGRVLCSGTWADLPRLNLNLRTGERVLIVLGTFSAGDFEALFQGTRALPWERFIPKGGQFPVKGHCLNAWKMIHRRYRHQEEKSQEICGRGSRQSHNSSVAARLIQEERKIRTE